MCVAIHKPADKTLTKDRLRICDINNPDGAGYAAVVEGRLIVEKGFSDFEEFWRAFDQIQHGNQCLVHFRVASAGSKDMANCHPWLVSDTLAIVHNGTLEDFKVKDSEESDTSNFNEQVLKELFTLLGPKFYLSPVIHYLLRKTIGDSKMAFLDADGDCSIINQERGVADDGVWYSNESFRAVKTTKSSNNSNNGVKDGTPFSHQCGSRGKQLFRYLFAGGDGEFLTSQQIGHMTTKTYRCKLKKLVDKGILLRVAVDHQGIPIDNQPEVTGEAGLDLWLKFHLNDDRNDEDNQRPDILEAQIVASSAAS